MTDFAVRTARVDDVDAVLELWRTASENDSRSADSRAAVVAVLERDPAALLVAVSDDELIGSLIAGGTGGGPTCTAWPFVPIIVVTASGEPCSLPPKLDWQGLVRDASRDGARRQRSRSSTVAGRRLPPSGGVGPLGQESVGPSLLSARRARASG